MSGDVSPIRPSITESPRYWLYVFCTAGLVALLLAGPKFAARQSQIERKSQGRQRAIDNLAGRSLVTELSDERNTQIRLQPLYISLGGILAAAWVHFLWTRWFRRRRESLRVHST